MSKNDKTKLLYLLRISAQRNNDYRKGKTTFEEVMIAKNMVDLSFFNILNETIFETLVRVQDIEQKLKNIHDSNE